MTTENKFKIYNVLALICAIWFLLLGWTWIYWLNVIFVFPFALLGLFLWWKGRGAQKKLLNKIVGWTLWAGMVSSLGFLISTFMRK